MPVNFNQKDIDNDEDEENSTEKDENKENDTKEGDTAKDNAKEGGTINTSVISLFDYLGQLI